MPLGGNVKHLKVGVVDRSQACRGQSAPELAMRDAAPHIDHRVGEGQGLAIRKGASAAS